MSQQKMILIIEDDSAIAASLESGLRREGYYTVWKNRGDLGIEYAQKQTVDLIILDVRLPDGSGFDICKQMRALNFKQPIVMLTVQSDEIDKVLGLEAGADDYLTKPYSFRELLARVRAHLRRSYGDLANANSDTLYVHDIVIDRLAGTVLQGTQVLNLTPIEYKILAYMAQYVGQALSREQIIENVWGYADSILDNQVVNVHIRHLRKKIEIDPGKPKILLTVPGIGYRLTK